MTMNPFLVIGPALTFMGTNVGKKCIPPFDEGKSVNLNAKGAFKCSGGQLERILHILFICARDEESPLKK
jgi:hypothetical protein